MTPSDIPAEIAYRISERLGHLYEDRPAPEDAIARVTRAVHADCKANWPEQYAEAVETGRVVG